MKLLVERIGPASGLLAASLLWSLEAMAVGTLAGTDVQNLAIVNYDVNGNPQTFIESAPGAGNNVPGLNNGTTTDFTVDNRVDFQLVEQDGAHVTITPGETGVLTEFLLTNVGNSPQDWRLLATNLAGGSVVFGEIDDADMASLTVLVDNNGNSTPEPGTDQDYVDELDPDLSVTIWVSADADVTVTNGQFANIDLLAVTADADGVGGTLGGDTVDDAGNPDNVGSVDVVFAEGGVLGDGQLNEQSGYTVSSANLFISKTSLLISDPFNGTNADRKHIPGAVVRYTITVDNSGGAQDAENVVVTDDLTDVTLAGDITITNGGAPPFTCTGDGGDADNDGCAYDGTTVTVGDNVDLTINVLQAQSMTVAFDVTID